MIEYIKEKYVNLYKIIKNWFCLTLGTRTKSLPLDNIPQGIIKIEPDLSGLKISKNFKRKILPFYIWYAETFSEGRFNLDFSKEAIQSYYDYETFGKGDPVNLNINPINGCAYAKHWFDAMIKEYNKGIKDGLFLRSEFLEDVPEQHKWIFEKNLIGTGSIC
jgi:hypothetical protein